MASKFAGFSDHHGKRLKDAAEKLYRSLEYYNALDLVDKPEDCACAIFLLADLKELGSDTKNIAATFNANESRVSVLLTMVLSKDMGLDVDGNGFDVDDYVDELNIDEVNTDDVD